MRHRLDFTIDPINYKGLPEYVNELHDQGLHYITILVIALIHKSSLSHLSSINCSFIRIPLLVIIKHVVRTRHMMMASQMASLSTILGHRNLL